MLLIIKRQRVNLSLKQKILAYNIKIKQRICSISHTAQPPVHFADCEYHVSLPPSSGHANDRLRFKDCMAYLHCLRKPLYP